MPVSFFKGNPDFGDRSNSELLRQTFLVWLDWGFTTAGAYFNYTIPTSGAYGGEFTRLRPARDPNYTDGRVWETFRSNLVWESGLSNGTPIDVSGVYVDGTFNPTSSGGHVINYPLGRVIFDSPISTGSTVQMEYSLKHMRILDANDIPVFRRAQLESYRVDNSNFLQFSSGVWSQVPEARIQLPFVAVDVASNRNYQGYELGNSTLQTKTDIICHVVGENFSDVDRAADILGQQKDSKIYLFNSNLMADDGFTVLSHSGSKTNNTQTYPQLVRESGRYRSTECYITDSSVQKTETIGNDVFKRTVRLTCEILV